MPFGSREGEPIVGCTETVDEGWAGAPELRGGFVVLGYGQDCTEA